MDKSALSQSRKEILMASLACAAAVYLAFKATRQSKTPPSGNDVDGANNRDKRNADANHDKETFKLTLALCACMWPVLYFKFFPNFVDGKNKYTYFIGCIAPILYLLTLAASDITQEKIESVSKAFSKETSISTSLLVLQSMNQEGQDGVNARKGIGASMALGLLSIVLDADVSKTEFTAREAAVVSLRTGAVFTSIAVILGRYLEDD